MAAPRFILPPEGTFTPNGDADPLPFYYRPLIGRIYTARINTALSLVEGRFRRLLEIGYGSGLLMPTLATISDELCGADLEPEPAALRPALARLGVAPKEIVSADVQGLPFPTGHFDGVVALSILEHLKRDQLARAAREVARVLGPGGRFLAACPAVHPVMNLAFSAIGFSAIERFHFSGLRDVLAATSPYFTLERKAALPRLIPLPMGWALYGAVLLRKR
jgi:SAM-dependent methyltransferase